MCISPVFINPPGVLCALAPSSLTRSDHDTGNLQEFPLLREIYGKFSHNMIIIQVTLRRLMFSGVFGYVTPSFVVFEYQPSGRITLQYVALRFSRRDRDLSG